MAGCNQLYLFFFHIKKYEMEVGNRAVSEGSTKRKRDVTVRTGPIEMMFLAMYSKRSRACSIRKHLLSTSQLASTELVLHFRSRWRVGHPPPLV